MPAPGRLRAASLLVLATAALVFAIAPLAACSSQDTAQPFTVLRFFILRYLMGAAAFALGLWTILGHPIPLGRLSGCLPIVLWLGGEYGVSLLLGPSISAPAATVAAALEILSVVVGLALAAWTVRARSSAKMHALARDKRSGTSTRR